MMRGVLRHTCPSGATRMFALVALLALILLTTLTTPRLAHAEPPPLDVGITLSAETVTLGERLHLRLTVTHPSDVVVSVQPIARTPTLHVIEVLPPRQTLAGAETRSQFEYVLAAFNLDPFVPAPLRLAWLRADGEGGEIEVAPPPFTVRSTVGPNDRSLRPLKPTLEIAGAPPSWQGPAIIGGAAAGLLLLLLGSALALRARRRNAAPVPVAAERPVTIEDTARARLGQMAAAAPLARNDYGEYYGTIATVVRDYLQDRFEFGARALTTPELQRRMVGKGVERWQARLVGGLLDRCDGAVYAGRRPDPASADHDLTVAFEIIELSRPAPELATEDLAPAGRRR